MSPSELCEAVPGTGGSLSTGFTLSLLPPPHSSHQLNTPRLKTRPLKCCGMLQSSFCLPIFSHFMLQKSLYLIPFYGCGLGAGAGVRKSGNLYNPAIQCRSPEVWRFQTSIEISEGLGSFNRMSPSNMCYFINSVLQPVFLTNENWKACLGFLTWEQIELTKSICIKFSVSPWSVSFQHLLRPCPQCDRSSSCPGLASCRHVSIVSNVWQFGNLLRLRH